jgi:hypothetical protein
MTIGFSCFAYVRPFVRPFGPKECYRPAATMFVERPDGQRVGILLCKTHRRAVVRGSRVDILHDGRRRTILGQRLQPIPPDPPPLDMEQGSPGSPGGPPSRRPKVLPSVTTVEPEQLASAVTSYGTVLKVEGALGTLFVTVSNGQGRELVFACTDADVTTLISTLRAAQRKAKKEAQ